jgi:hypothetical protein
MNPNYIQALSLIGVIAEHLIYIMLVIGALILFKEVIEAKWHDYLNRSVRYGSHMRTKGCYHGISRYDDDWEV